MTGSGQDGGERDDAADALKARLSVLRDEPLDDAGFRQSLHLRLALAGPPEPRRAWARLRSFAPVLWPLSGALAGVLAFVLAGKVASPPPVQAPASAPVPVAAAVAPPERPGSVVPASKVAILKLDFTVDVAVEDAEFEVSLPEGLAFWVGGEAVEARAFSWRQPLREGSNVVPVAVRGKTPGRYTVSARARVEGRDIVHDVVLEVTSG
jgi:hypothetical protein